MFSGMKKRILPFLVLLSFVLFMFPCFFKTQGLGGRYGERLVRLEATFKVFMEQTDNHLFMDSWGAIFTPSPVL